MTSTDSTSFEVVEDQEESLSRLLLRENKTLQRIEKNPFLACFSDGHCHCSSPEIPSKVDSSSVHVVLRGF